MHSSLPQQFANFGRFNWGPVVGAFRRLEQYTLAGTDGVIAICPELRDYVEASGYPGPVALIENTMDFEPPPIEEGDVLALRMRLGLGRGPAIVYTGTLESYQGLDLLLAAAPDVARRLPDARFVLVGGTASQVEGLKATTRSLGVESSFVFVGSVAPTEVFLYHRLADALVTTRSKGTNTPLKIYQYLRAGRPIVATDIHSHTQVLTPDSAELVAPTPAGIAAGLLRVLTDPERAARLSRAAGTLAEERYGEARYMETLRGLLDSTMSARRVRKSA
jgi:glycosyltransferase involved in cell wall biosynthesis